MEIDKKAKKKNSLINVSHTQEVEKKENEESIYGESNTSATSTNESKSSINVGSEKIKNKVTFNENRQEQKEKSANNSNNNSKSNSSTIPKKLTISDFKLNQTLGRGAFAKVVHGEHKGKNFAIKVIDKKFIEKFEKIHEVHTEKQILSSMNHPNIIKLHFTFQDSKSLYFVLDYCANKDLSIFLKANVILSKELAQYYTAEIVYALEYLRKKGIAHRDLKPENIMLDEKMKIKIVSLKQNFKRFFIYFI